MIKLKTRHFKQERETWLHRLDYIQQENILLKNSLADITKMEIDARALEKIEYFQNQFLEKDALITFLRRDIAEQNRLLDDAQVSESAHNKFLYRQDRLRSDIERAEKELSGLKHQFNLYMSQMLYQHNLVK